MKPDVIIVIKCGRQLYGVQQPRFITTWEMLTNLHTFVDLSATNPADKSMIFHKIEAFESMDGFNSVVKEKIQAAREGWRFPVMQYAACGDASAIVHRHHRSGGVPGAAADRDGGPSAAASLSVGLDDSHGRCEWPVWSSCWPAGQISMPKMTRVTLHSIMQRRRATRPVLRSFGAIKRPLAATSPS